MGVPESVIPEMADKAEKDHSTPTNPRPCSVADYAALMRESIAGESLEGFRLSGG
jgi:alcohol dehydrogenase class IV